jgi:hypothetical protein
MGKMVDAIRAYAREKYVVPARNLKQARFTIRSGEVVQALKLHTRVANVCNALRGKAFQNENRLKLVDYTGPKSGQSTTMVYTYQFDDAPDSAPGLDPWTELRGALKRAFAESGGGENYLRNERENFYVSQENS